MKVLIVQKRLPYQPQLLDRQADNFLQEVGQMVSEAQEQYNDVPLELADIGFIPTVEYVEVKLYFREPDWPEDGIDLSPAGAAAPLTAGLSPETDGSPD